MEILDARSETVGGAGLAAVDDGAPVEEDVTTDVAAALAHLNRSINVADCCDTDPRSPV
jgi:hypothetical protein